jgi:hypothetical protein
MSTSLLSDYSLRERRSVAAEVNNNRHRRSSERIVEVEQSAKRWVETIDTTRSQS